MYMYVNKLYVYNENITTSKQKNKNAYISYWIDRQIADISTLEGNKIVDHSDVVGASPVGAAPTTSSFST